VQEQFRDLVGSATGECNSVAVESKQTEMIVRCCQGKSVFKM
jgi:hypothetical protein